MLNVTKNWSSIVFGLLIGCTHAGRIGGPANKPPDGYSTMGTTTNDYALVSPVPLQSRVVTVSVKLAGATDWQVLNQYEYVVTQGNNGNGGIQFGKAVIDSGGLLTIFDKPVAPTGTEYKIVSWLVYKAF